MNNTAEKTTSLHVRFFIFSFGKNLKNVRLWAELMRTALWCVIATLVPGVLNYTLAQDAAQTATNSASSYTYRTPTASAFTGSASDESGARSDTRSRNGSDTGKVSEWYIGVGGGFSNLSPDASGTFLQIADDNDTGFKLFAGYDFSEYFTAEFFYANLGSSTLFNQNIPEQEGDIDYSVLSLGLLLYFNQDDSGYRQGFQPFLKAGASVLDADRGNNLPGITTVSQESTSQVHIGAGFEYAWSSRWAARFDVDLFSDDARFASFNVLRRFGGDGPSTERKPTRVKQVAPPPAPKPPPEPPVPAPIVEPVRVVPQPVPPPPPPPPPQPSFVANPAPTTDCLVFQRDLQNVDFLRASAALTNIAKVALSRIAQTMLSDPNLAIEVRAHTDSEGSESNNQKLSNQRAISVASYLVFKGVATNRLKARGLGEQQPIASNKTAAGRAKNRRVEFKLLGGGRC